jgi:hypothetical protein
MSANSINVTASLRNAGISLIVNHRIDPADGQEKAYGMCMVIPETCRCSLSPSALIDDPFHTSKIDVDQFDEEEEEEDGDYIPEEEEPEISVKKFVAMMKLEARGTEFH